jgi:hypothetical protein
MPTVRLVNLIAALVLLSALPRPAASQHRVPPADDAAWFATAQAAHPGPGGVGSHAAAPLPRWVKWGLVGAGTGALLGVALGGMSIEPRPALHNAFIGAAGGFVILGGSIAAYDLVCAPGSASRRSGLCTGPGSRSRR